MLIKTGDLTKGEKLLLARRRLGMTQSDAAKKHLVSLYMYRQWECDVDGITIPTVKVGKLEEHEQCFLMRRRLNMTLAETADKIGICRWWLCQMENGKAPIDRLLAHWAA